VLTIPFLRKLFQFAPMHRWELALIAIACLVSITIAESVKLKPIRKFINGN
jgi:hypothetical protein